jgi:hypothetical protein
MSAIAALLPVRLGYHWLRDRAHFAPRPWFRSQPVRRGAFDSAAIVEQLRTDGVCVLERYLDDGRLASVQAAAAAALEAAPVNGPDARTVLQIDLNPYPALAELLLDDLILAACEGYYGRPVFLAHHKLQRLEPTAPYEDRAFRWHHDNKGPYLRAMWLLTDVPADGQRMSFVVGSHRQWRPLTGYAETRFGDGEARRLGPVVECAGPAGSVVLFDANGIHRGNRNQGPRRETLFGTYTVGRYLRGACVEARSLPPLTARQRAVLERSTVAASPRGSADAD